VKTIFPVLVFVVIGLFHSACCGAAMNKPPERFDVGQIDSYLSAEVLLNGRIGLSVAIVRDGNLVLAKGYGQASIKAGTPVSTDAMFAIGSVTKQFTCACVLLLAEEGKLSVHDKVSRYFPNVTRADAISLLDLMNHTSGIPDYYPLDFVDRRMQKPIDPDALIVQYAGGKVDFEPGTAWSYSNTGYILLGRIVEKVSGQSFTQFLHDRILQPLNLEHTIYQPDTGDKRLATGYTSFALSDSEPAQPEAQGWIGSAGGLYSTPTDLTKWDLALLEGRVLRPDYYRIMTTARELSPEHSTGYACGLSIANHEGRTVLRHGGAVSGFTAFNALIPSTRSALVLLCNKDGGLGTLSDVLLELLLREESNVPKIAGASAADTVKAVLLQFQSGKLDRSQFGDEFNAYLSEKKFEGASGRLKNLGTPGEATVTSTHERGGMEVTRTTVSFPDRKVEILMYRTPDGKIEQFFIDEP
jgi:CubicO group peptidase (beta-lactamase class C family)